MTSTTATTHDNHPHDHHHIDPDDHPHDHHHIAHDDHPHVDNDKACCEVD